MEPNAKEGKKPKESEPSKDDGLISKELEELNKPVEQKPAEEVAEVPKKKGIKDKKCVVQ